MCYRMECIKVVMWEAYMDLIFGLYHLSASPVPRASQIDAKLNILMEKKENVIPQRLTEFMMHQNIFSTKWRQTYNFSPSSCS